MDLATWTRPSRPTEPGFRRKLAPLGLAVSNPPAQADVQALADTQGELINTLNA